MPGTRGTARAARGSLCERTAAATSDDAPSTAGEGLSSGAVREPEAAGEPSRSPEVAMAESRDPAITH